jgi:hypothetical protein
MFIWTFLPQMTLGMRSISGGKTLWITPYIDIKTFRLSIAQTSLCTQYLHFCMCCMGCWSFSVPHTIRKREKIRQDKYFFLTTSWVKLCVLWICIIWHGHWVLYFKQIIIHIQKERKTVYKTINDLYFKTINSGIFFGTCNMAVLRNGNKMLFWHKIINIQYWKQHVLFKENN